MAQGIKAPGEERFDKAGEPICCRQGHNEWRWRKVNDRKAGAKWSCVLCERAMQKHARATRPGFHEHAAATSSRFRQRRLEEDETGFRASNAVASKKWREEQRKNDPIAFFAARIMRRGYRRQGADLTAKYLIYIYPKDGCCPCCGELMLFFEKPHHPKSPSLDRLDPFGGYMIRNVAWICLKCNQQKRDSTPEQLRQIADFIEYEQRVAKEEAERYIHSTETEEPN